MAGFEDVYEIGNQMDFWSLTSDLGVSKEIAVRRNRWTLEASKGGKPTTHKSWKDIEQELLSETINLRIALPAWLDHHSVCNGLQKQWMQETARSLTINIGHEMRPEWDVYALEGRRENLIKFVEALKEQVLRPTSVPVDRYAGGAEALDCLCGATIYGAICETKLNIPYPKYYGRFHVHGTVSGPLLGAAVVTGRLNDGLNGYQGWRTLAQERERQLDKERRSHEQKPLRKFPWFDGLA